MSSSSDDEACKKGRKPKNQDGPKKKGVDSRCSPSRINKIMISIINDNERMAEVDAMGFANFQHILEWIVNQEIYMYLATKFDLENNVIKDDVANIEINAEIVERALGLLLVIFTWIKDAIKDFQKKGVKHLSACMFVVVVIYFQRLKWGRLDRCRSPEPWIIDWSLTNLEHRATTALKSDDQEEGARYNMHEEEPINNERDDQSEEGVIEDEEVLKRWTQIEEELKRRTIGIEKKKLTKEQEEEIEATLK
ncbi:hypothetical protein PIB30_082423, partial [Stylosanthes scabra]|nr:hypothetical protein [Stylosanthes scabra]